MDFTEMLWTVFHQSTVSKDIHVDYIRFDYYIPEYNLLLDIKGDLHFEDDGRYYKFRINPNGSTEMVDLDSVKEEMLKQGYKYIVLSTNVGDAREELVHQLNKFSILHIPGVEPQIRSPKYCGDAGFDIVCSESMVCEPGQGTDIPSDLYLEIPNHLFGLIQARSSTSRKRLLVLPGIIDAGYRGRIYTMAFNPTMDPIEVNKGDRIAQMLFFYRIPHMNYDEVFSLRKSARDINGFGSSGS